MDKNIKDREKKVYNDLFILKNGTDSDKSLAFECIGILGNESTLEPFESRLSIVEELIKKHRGKKIKKQSI